MISFADWYFVDQEEILQLSWPDSSPMKIGIQDICILDLEARRFSYLGECFIVQLLLDHEKILFI